MPGDTRPHVARAAKARRRARKAADMTVALRVAWTSIREAERVLLAADTDVETRLKSIHAITQALSAYNKLSEAVELEARITELESEMARERI